MSYSMAYTAEMTGSSDNLKKCFESNTSFTKKKNLRILFQEEISGKFILVKKIIVSGDYLRLAQVIHFSCIGGSRLWGKLEHGQLKHLAYEMRIESILQTSKGDILFMTCIFKCILNKKNQKSIF